MNSFERKHVFFGQQQSTGAPQLGGGAQHFTGAGAQHLTGAGAQHFTGAGAQQPQSWWWPKPFQLPVLNMFVLNMPELNNPASAFSALTLQTSKAAVNVIHFMAENLLRIFRYEREELQVWLLGA